MQKRILGVCSRLEAAEELIDKCRELSGRLEAGVTLLYVKEEGLFELPIYEGREATMEAAREHLESLLRNRGIEGWALLVRENDLPDQAALEAQRESSLLMVADRNDELPELMAKVRRTLYVLLPGQTHCPSRGLLVTETAGAGRHCLNLARQAVPDIQWKAYMDYQFFPTMADAEIDPVVGAMTPEILAEEESEIMQSRRESFESFCREEGIEGVFEVGEHGVEEDVLERLQREGDDLLMIAAEDPESVLGEGAKALILSAPVDTLVCFNVQGL